MAAHFLTVNDLSLRWQVPKSTIYAWVAKGILQASKMGGLLRFHLDYIARWEESRKTGQKENPVLNGDATIRNDVDILIARAKRDAYTPRHGETRPLSSLNRKEGDHGAL